MHGSVVCVFSPPAGAGADYVRGVVDHMRRHIVPSAPFDRRLDRSVRGRLWPTWQIVQEIDPEYHLRHKRLPAPGGQAEFRALISELHSIPLDPAHPLWTIDVIEGLEGGRFAVFGKMHHALADGVAALGIVGKWLSPDPDARNVPPIWAYPRPSQRGGRQAAGRSRRLSPLRAIPSPLRAVSAAAATANAARYAVTGVAARPWSAPRTVLNAPITARRRIATASYELARFRDLAERTGATINDVVLAVCSGGLRGYLAYAGELPSRPLITNIPVSVRNGDGRDGGNAISWAMVSLATDIGDPRRRFESIRTATADAKRRIAQMDSGTVETYTLLTVTPILVEQLTRAAGHVPPQFNIPISNVPGPRERLYLNGAEMEEIQALTVIYGGQALNVVTLSYADRLDFAITACPDSVPDVDRLAGAITAALGELEQAFPGPRVPAAAALRPRRAPTRSCT
jgi:WS/DGAT/MGAT family acyltransferase